MLDRYNTIKSLKNKKGGFLDMVKEQLTCLIDKDLKTEFQIIAKRQDTTVTALITEFVTKYVNENK